MRRGRRGQGDKRRGRRGRRGQGDKRRGRRGRAFKGKSVAVVAKASRSSRSSSRITMRRGRLVELPCVAVVELARIVLLPFVSSKPPRETSGLRF